MVSVIGKCHVALIVRYPFTRVI